MNVSFKPLQQQVIIITGASSGIGLATALTAAQQGAAVVLAARNQEALRQVTEQITAAGGPAIYVVADMGQRAEVQQIADRAIEQFGGFDTWVNDAGLGIWGCLEEVSDEDHRRLFDTNFWGVVYGSLIAVEHLKQRGGKLINLGSVASDIAFPLQGMYQVCIPVLLFIPLLPVPSPLWLVWQPSPGSLVRETARTQANRWT